MGLGLFLGGAGAGAAEGPDDSWQKADRPRAFEFPRDHFTHNDFRTEWWYATGRVRTAEGRKFGYQFTLFRRGVRPPADRAEATSRWVVDHLPLGHFALSDVDGGKFYFDQRLERGAFGRAGFPDMAESSGREKENRLAWVGDWELALGGDGSFSVKASQSGAILDLKLQPLGAPILQGAAGLSQKSAGAGNASYYYSMPRMKTEGSVQVDGKSFAVSGLSWLDREWATNQLGAGQVGWDWISLHLSDGRDLMLYRLRRADRSADEFSSGTLIAADRGSRHLGWQDFSLTPQPGKTWTSARSGGVYPIAWRIEIPSESLILNMSAAMPDQELALSPVAYWEGAVDAAGTASGQAVTAEGYLEMTGYSGPLQALKQ
ncbi:MAG: hypothetical protein JWL81_725 [Verrucomicrobiales bacterium]|nr:hypothetical protein [Verrucomicrobiales bacterium]